MYSFTCARSSSKKNLEIENEKIYVKSIFFSFFSFLKPTCHKSLAMSKQSEFFLLLGDVSITYYQGFEFMKCFTL